VLILGDVLFHRNPATLRKGPQEPFPFLTFDRGMSIASARRLAALGPNVICFGHGAPLMDGSEFSRFVERLPAA
jgi:glyoxylase-like metal-dependent hydrolase (beta-lactamase superfamily II)